MEIRFECDRSKSADIYNEQGKCWGWFKYHVYDMGRIYHVERVYGEALAGPSEASYDIKIDVELSEDKVNWVRIGSVYSNPRKSGYAGFNFVAGINARYLRFTSDKYVDGSHGSIIISEILPEPAQPEATPVYPTTEQYEPPAIQPPAPIVQPPEPQPPTLIEQIPSVILEHLTPAEQQLLQPQPEQYPIFTTPEHGLMMPTINIPLIPNIPQVAPYYGQQPEVIQHLQEIYQQQPLQEIHPTITTPKLNILPIIIIGILILLVISKR